MLIRALGDEAVRVHFAVAVVVALTLDELRSRLVEVRLSIDHALLRERRIDPREKSSLLDVIVEVDEEIGDLPGDLRADADGRDGAEGAGGGNGLLEIAALDVDEAE